MRIRIIRLASETCIDGLRLDHFLPGQQYEVGNTLGALFLSEGWAEPVDDPEPALVIPLRDLAADASESFPPNLIRDIYPPYYRDRPTVAMDRRRRPRHKTN
jgi:hypothetical protein